MQINNIYARGAGSRPYLPKAKEKLSDYSKLQPEVVRLKALDTVMRAHKATYTAAEGRVVTDSARFSFAHEVDGRMHAGGGEVGIDIFDAPSPEAAVIKARTIATAALAPANPSAQDFKVASTALIMEHRAQIEVIKEIQVKLTKLNGAKSYAEVSVNNIYERQTVNSTIVDEAIPSSDQNGVLLAS